MPTERRRHSITETEEIARALDDAARRWPGDRGRRSRLLLRLVQAGHEAIGGEREDDAARRREAISRTSGALTGAYPEEYLSRLRDDWAE
ncbi:MAG: hypothetical protein WD844_01585 [Thermoleophilaceae bacterium]